MSADEVGDVTMSCTFRPIDGSREVVLRQVALGYQPIVLIEPEVESGDVIFKVDCTGLDRAELADVLSVLADGLANASDDDITNEGDDEDGDDG